MPTFSVLQNSPNNLSVPPVKHAASGIDAEGGSQPGGASFGKVLAQEMNGKYDAAEARHANANTVSGTAPGKLSGKGDAAAGNLKELNERALKDPQVLKDLDSSEDVEEPESSKDSKNLKGPEINSVEDGEAATDTAAFALIATAPPVPPAGILPGLVAAHPLPVPTEAPAETQAEISSGGKAGIPADDRAAVRIGAKVDSPVDARTDAPGDAGTDVPADAQAADGQADVLEAKSATPAGQQGAIAVMQSTLAAARFGKAGNDGSAMMAPAAAGHPSHRISGIVAPAAPARTRQAAIGQDIQDATAAVKLDLPARRSASQETEFNSPEIGGTGQTDTLERPSLDFVLKDMPAANPPNALTAAPATLAVVAADYGAAPAAAGVPAYPSLWLEPRLGTTGWDNALGQKVLWMVSNQQQVAELNLDPPDLGPLQVTLSISNDQASAMFVSQHADVRQALEAALPRLKEMMADSGISLGNATVSAETPQQQGGFERQYQPGAHQPHRSRETVTAAAVKSADIGMSYTGAGRSRLVDTFA